MSGVKNVQVSKDANKHLECWSSWTTYCLYIYYYISNWNKSAVSAGREIGYSGNQIICLMPYIFRVFWLTILTN